MTNIKLSWSSFKAIVSSKNLFIQYKERNSSYTIFAVDGVITYSCRIEKNSGSEQSDFETNYKSSSNKPILPRDNDQAELSRTKITQTGWHFKMHAFEFETAVVGSNIELDSGGSQGSATTIKLYKANGDLITDQSVADTDCVKTVLDFEPSYDYEVIGGQFKQKAAPSSNVYLNVVGVPDIPSNYGGSKVFATGINLYFLGTASGIVVDGKAPKLLTYSATYHTNKMRFILNHDAGFKHRMTFIMEYFKA